MGFADHFGKGNPSEPSTSKDENTHSNGSEGYFETRFLIYASKIIPDDKELAFILRREAMRISRVALRKELGCTSNSWIADREDSSHFIFCHNLKERPATASKEASPEVSH